MPADRLDLGPVAVLHTRGSPCRCGASISAALARLGRRSVVIDVAALLSPGGERALEGARLAFDHTDTVGGRSELRGAPRRRLEELRVSVAGGTAETCELADDKVRAHARLAERGVSVPPGGAIERAEDDVLSLGWPRVLKARFEHMSRGIAVVRDPAEQRARAGAFFEAFGGPLLLEEHVSGRELAVTLVEPPGEPVRALPIVEWTLAGPVLTLDQKLDGERRPAPAALEASERAAVEAAARAAFAALGLRDYARVDLRLDERGRPFVLEVNPRPSLELLGPTDVAAKAAGLSLDQVIAWALARAEERLANRRA